MYLVINKWVIAVKVSNFYGQYLRNHWTLDIGVLGYIGILWPKEHSPEVRSFPPGTPCICRHTATAHFSQLTNKVLTLLSLNTACTGVHCGLKYQHWPMKQILAVDQEGFQWRTVPIKFRQNLCSKIGFPQSIFSATGGPTHMPLIVLG